MRQSLVQVSAVVGRTVATETLNMKPEIFGIVSQ